MDPDGKIERAIDDLKKLIDTIKVDPDGQIERAMDDREKSIERAMDDREKSIDECTAVVVTIRTDMNEIRTNLDGIGTHLNEIRTNLDGIIRLKMEALLDHGELIGERAVEYEKLKRVLFADR